MKQKHVLYAMMIVMCGLCIAQAMIYDKNKKDVSGRIENLHKTIEINSLSLKAIEQNLSLLYKNEFCKIEDISLWDANNKEYRLSQILSDEMHFIFFFDQKCCSDCVDAEMRRLLEHFNEFKEKIIVISNFSGNSAIQRFIKNYRLNHNSSKVFQIKNTLTGLNITDIYPSVFIVDNSLSCYLFSVIDFYQPNLTSMYYETIKYKIFIKYLKQK